MRANAAECNVSGAALCSEIVLQTCGFIHYITCTADHWFVDVYTLHSTMAASSYGSVNATSRNANISFPITSEAWILDIGS